MASQETKCETCKHNGWLTMDDVAICNTCSKNYDHYNPVTK